MGKTRTVEESIRGKERENMRVAKKDRKKVTVEGDGRGGGGVEEWGGEGEDGVGDNSPSSFYQQGWGGGLTLNRPSVLHTC